MKLYQLITIQLIYDRENCFYSKLTFFRPLSTDGPGFVSGSYPWVPDGIRELVFSWP